ncbi:PIN-like domain-containing protein [uncultured Aquimarina sp.]|uniref:PIN-like domain-containing protein n=1 Tax=uncultured Aquimarina sp. TaxID=575652 RepID=UPI00260242CC|nr:PIN-like domain-containing protein [uncultured Aquimarina sp.]
MRNDLYQMTEEKEKRLWDNAIFIFDSSALLDFYFLPKITREKIFNNLLEKKLHNRLWIPAHVQFEYLKNRETTICKPIVENYKPLKEELKKINSFISNTDKCLSSIKNRTKNDDKHPHLPKEKFNNFSKQLKDFIIKSEEFEKSIITEIAIQEEEINNLLSDDDVQKAIYKNFEVGENYNFEEILKITKEGKHRYEFSIPPGYMDRKDKQGTQIFGDLIVWKQILEYSKKTQKPVLFICNDLKEDWCYLENTTEKRIKSPREELIKEIYDHSNTEFWMYNLPQFLFMANKHIEETVNDSEILSFYKTLDSKGKIRIGHYEIAPPDHYTCDACDQDGNFVSFWTSQTLNNEYPITHPRSKLSYINTSNCTKCNTLHIQCHECEQTTGISDTDYNEKIECIGGCGNVFYVDTSNDYDYIGEYEIILKDHRAKKCNSCNEEFVNEFINTETCYECEEKYIHN